MDFGPAGVRTLLEPDRTGLRQGRHRSVGGLVAGALEHRLGLWKHGGHRIELGIDNVSRLAGYASQLVNYAQSDGYTVVTSP